VIGPPGTGSDERLRRIEAVTDAALAHLDVEHLLSELLERVIELLQVDTAAVLLLDPHAQQLVATAAKGLEEEVRQGVRLPVGAGFAGRIALEGHPIALEHVDRTMLLNPILRDKGVASLLGVPMMAGGEVIGVLHVGTLEPRRFTDGDVHLLQVVADRASLATQARLSGIDRAAALALQRSLLPARLPTIPGLDLAARYVPGHDTGVGGDWYDVFRLPSGWIGIVVGDVAGHGLRAAVVMGRLRSALRAYALECDDPADVLTRLDHKIRHFEAGHLATALYAMIDPNHDRVYLSLAGHPPPIITAVAGDAEILDLPTDPPLGIGSHEIRRSTMAAMPAGSVAVFYTDGLVERRGEVIDEGLQRLKAAIKPGPPESLCTSIMATLVNGDVPTDDVALLVLRRDQQLSN
jgi:sigma-B regulation protein RsbU (phosphoserine phosphatase)